jgi:hypothetical protein
MSDDVYRDPERQDAQGHAAETRLSPDDRDARSRPRLPRRIAARNRTGSLRRFAGPITRRHREPSTGTVSRCFVGIGDVSLYLATRHYFGWYALNVLELPPHVIALQLGHD